MSRKENPAPMEEQESQEQQPGEVTEEYRQEDETAAETFTVTREQMEKMEALAKQLEAAWRRSTTTTASAPPRRRKASTRMPRSTPSPSSWRSTTTWSGR